MKSLIKHAAVLFLIVGIGTLPAADNKRPLFGEMHIHTTWSFDAYLFGTRATPDDAYEFAKGEPLKHPLGQTYQINRPLDFMAVTDHGMFLGVFANMGDKTHPLSQHPLAAKVNGPAAMLAFGDISTAQRDPELSKSLMVDESKLNAWNEIIASANRHYDPGKFTTLIAYEYSSTPEGQNLHRNVYFRGDTAPLPFTALDSMLPEDLWDWMESVRADGHDVMAVPHNSNQSDGRMFERQDSRDQPFSKAYAERRNRNEPLVEVTQVKGTSETHPMLSPNDEFADFELLEQRLSATRITAFAGGYVRDAYRSGLEFQDRQGFNPYRFGLIAASDSHTCIVPVEENHYSGKLGTGDGSPVKRMIGNTESQMDKRRFSASGLAGIWAEENTREGIFDALARKETWGTSGPRITVRFFGGFDMSGVRPGENGWVDAAYAAGVPMGSELNAEDANGRAPTFALWAMKDAESGNLDRIQIVKGWSVAGESREQVYDVIWSGDRKIDEATGKLPAVGNTVDMQTLEYTNAIGAVQLSGIWTDPDFSGEQNAFYYLRVLEIPTPRWSAFDAKKLGIPHPKDVPSVIQECAYTSPIWFDHH